MDKVALSLTALVVVIASIIIMPDEVLMVAEALYSIPPTPAWTNIGIDNNQVFPNSSDTVIRASNSSDWFYLVSDGSILINITSYP